MLFLFFYISRLYFVVEPHGLTPVAPSFFLATPAVALSINAQAGLELLFSHSSPPLQAGPYAEAGNFFIG
jgi:hypothetical protein